MSARRTTKIAVFTAMLVLVGSAALARPGLGDEDEAVSAAARGDVFELNAREGFAAEQAWRSAGASRALALVEYLRAPLCPVTSGEISTPGNGSCATNAGTVSVPDCEGVAPLEPLWGRSRSTPTAPWSAWTLVSPWSCPQDVLPAFTAEDFRRLPLTPAQVTIQPAAATVLINIPTITMATAAQQNLAADLLGYAVEVQATATSYSWDYGDGSAPSSRRARAAPTPTTTSTTATATPAPTPSR
ncbi:hypothetical protein [Actinotalea sp. JY-7876]|uniref:hypothetical protein n=1 Tax=Actinotalea sp. JY-7876 TaxID=2758442 RepID=UPI0015F58584|nr:hypothetical protein [Actinotalea sp. JY-7876]